MEMHIGSLIKARAKSVRIGPTELGIKIDSSKQNVYGIFKRESIDSELLYRICIALNYDFFQHLSEATQAKVGTVAAKAPINEPGEDNSMREEDLLRECMYLRRLNSLLEEKLSRCQNGLLD
jgi:hypothetical protein